MDTKSMARTSFIALNNKEHPPWTAAWAPGALIGEFTVTTLTL